MPVHQRSDEHAPQHDRNLDLHVRLSKRIPFVPRSGQRLHNVRKVEVAASDPARGATIHLDHALPPAEAQDVPADDGLA